MYRMLLPFFLYVINGGLLYFAFPIIAWIIFLTTKIMRQLKISQSITNRTDGSIDKYFAEINRFPMVSPEEEVSLAQDMHAGGEKGEKAKERLVTANLRFVVSVAKKYQNYGIPLSDLINEGNLGLITAANKFDETRGFKFISYAIWWIRQSILQAISGYSNMVRRPQSQIAVSNKIKNATNDFLQKNQRYPSAEELSDIISLEIEKIEKVNQSEAHIISIDTPVSEDEDSTIADMLASDVEYSTDRKVIHDSMCSDLNQIMTAVLSDREKAIVSQSYGIGCTERGLDDIGCSLGLSRERVRQIRERSIEKIRKCPKSYLLLKHIG